jgi:plasmid stability protein
VANITVSLPEETYRRVRIRAAEQGSSVSALVRRFLTDLGSAETDFERRKLLQDRMLTSIQRFTAGDRLDRDQVHNRAIR